MASERESSGSSEKPSDSTEGEEKKKEEKN